MTIPAIGGLSGAITTTTRSALPAALTNPAQPAGLAANLEGLGSPQATGAPGTTEALPASGAESAGGAESVGAGEAAGGGGEAAGGEGGFAGALGKALDSLERSQATAETASAQVATGQSSDPEAAVVSVSNAELEMQLASQMRTKATEALNTIFQTQV